MAGMMRPLPLLLAAWLAIVPVRVDPVTRVCTTAHDYETTVHTRESLTTSSQQPSI